MLADIGRGVRRILALTNDEEAKLICRVIAFALIVFD